MGASNGSTTLGSRGSAARAEALKQFVESFFQHYGADVSSEMEGDPPLPVVKVALTPDQAEHFGEANLTLTTSPRLQDAEIIVPGSRAFDLMMGWSRSLGGAAWVPLQAAHRAPSKLPKQVGPIRGFDLVPKVKQAAEFDLELAARVVFLADERHEELVLIYLPAGDTAHIVETSRVRELIEDDLVAEPSPKVKRPTKKFLGARFEELFQWLGEWAGRAAAPREVAIYEHLSREVQRLTSYFGELIAENELNDEVREQLASDLDRRIAEEVGNHRLGMNIDMLTYAIIARPQVLFTFTSDGPGAAIKAVWRFNRAEGAWLGPRCGACGERVLEAALCRGGDAKHVTCASCGDVCDVCGVDVCSEHGLVHCHLGGEPLCASCGPRCASCARPARQARLRSVDGDQVCESCRGDDS